MATALASLHLTAEDQARLIDWAGTELAERRLRHFVPQAWHTIEPFTPFAPNWHIDAICDHLEAVEAGQIRNLLITMPPRMLKSLTVSVFYPAWVWATAPERRFLYSSYSMDLATEHSVACRRVITSEWYQERWGDRFHLAEDANLKTRFENDKLGVRVATSVGGVVTGRGGDRIVVDDPHNVAESFSDAARAEAIRWWDQSMATRFNDPKTGARIIIMQRVHFDDLAGHVLKQGGYTHLNLPNEYEGGKQWTGVGRFDPRREEGELLFPERLDAAATEDLKRRLGSVAYAGQFQQRPVPAGGAIFKDTWWGYYDTLPPFDWKITAWDTAFKKGQENDRSAGVTVGQSGGLIYVLDVWVDRVEFPELKRVVREQALRHRPDEIIIEDKASGQSLIQELAKEAEWQHAGYPEGLRDMERERYPVLPIVPFNPGRDDKLARANSVTPYVEGGRVKLPREASWLSEFLLELSYFPLAGHDDIVDAYVMAMLRIIGREAVPQHLSDFMLAMFDQ